MQRSLSDVCKQVEVALERQTLSQGEADQFARDLLVRAMEDSNAGRWSAELFAIPEMLLRIRGRTAGTSLMPEPDLLAPQVLDQRG